jgi:hypothetical protein
MKAQTRYAFEGQLAEWSTQRETDPVYFDEQASMWRLLDYKTARPPR